MKSARSLINSRESFQNSSSDNLKTQFLLLSDEYSRLVELSGFKVVPYFETHLPHFSKLEVLKQKLVVDFLEEKIEFLNSAMQEGLSLKSNKQMLWHAIKSYQLTPSSDLMQYIENDDVVEVHWLNDLVQAYHSFTFYDKSSYSLEEICSSPWQNLYETDLQTQKNIFELAQKIISGKITSTVNPDIPSYIVSETQSAFKYQVQVNYKLVSPLFDKIGHPRAAVSIEKMEVISQSLNPLQEEVLWQQHKISLKNI